MCAQALAGSAVTQDSEHSPPWYFSHSEASVPEPPPGQGLVAVRFLRSREKVLESGLPRERRKLQIKVKLQRPCLRLRKEALT